MSSTRQAVVRAVRWTGAGNLPSLHPFHHVLFETGIIGGMGGFAFGLPIIWVSRTSPVAGSVDKGVMIVSSNREFNYVGKKAIRINLELGRTRFSITDFGFAS